MRGRPALIVLWQHNPDLTQHIAGLGTMPALESLSGADTNLGRVRAALDSNGIADRTDVIVVSDHGFATVRMTIDLNALLVGAGLKKDLDSDDVVVARNGGSDLVYLSKTAFPTETARHDELQKIVNFAEAQEWCGPIFSRQRAPMPIEGKHRRKPPPEASFMGWIDGTFAQEAIGILNPARSPDLTISFREISEQDNAQLTGPDVPAFAIAAKGQTSVKNNSKTLVHPVRGIMYADVGASFTTGNGDAWRGRRRRDPQRMRGNRAGLQARFRRCESDREYRCRARPLRASCIWRRTSARAARMRPAGY